MTESENGTLLRDERDETTVRGEIASVVFESQDGRFSVAKLLGLDGRETVVIGDLGKLSPGEQVRVTGRWEKHATFGQQLRAVTVVPELPTTKDGLQKLLGSGFVEGIGVEMARRIVDTFGTSTLDVILDHPERLREVEGIGKRRVKKIQSSFRARRAEAEARVFLQAAGIGPSLAARVISQYGDDTPNVVRSDPYRLAADVPTVGFKTADRIGQQLGIGPDDPRRAAAAVLYVVRSGSERGHTGVPIEYVQSETTALGVPVERVDQAVAALVQQGTVLHDRGLLFPPPLARAESRLAKWLQRARAQKTHAIDPSVLKKPEVERAVASLHALQRAAVEATLSAPVLVITGGPGTGKTTTVKAIVAVMKAAGREIQLAAPTGRAARRMTEATGEPARTIHRMLEWNPRLSRFVRGPDVPIVADVVLVDESSMLDVVLADRLVSALAAGTQLVLVGDADQLPSVGPGTVLADLLATPWIPSVRLTEVFRQAAASAIVQGAHRILHGARPATSPARDPKQSAPPHGEFYFVRAEDPDRAASLLVATVIERIPQQFGLHPLRDIQVLVPTHRGPLGTTNLNAQLQPVLNPNAKPSLGDTPVRPTLGDKVMQLRNDYDLEVWNGDIGMVVGKEGEDLVVSMDGRTVTYKGDARDALALAYAATVHKAQGSEYDSVVIGLHTHHYVLLNRALVYTAITRAKRLAVIVGSERALGLAIANAKTQQRFGALRARLSDE